MNAGELESYVDHSRAAIEESPEMSLRNTELRLVHPLLELLGWDVRRSEVEADYAVDGHTVDYALLVDDTPQILLLTRACGTALTNEAGATLTDALRAAGVDWGLVTNGRTFVFVGPGADDGFETLHCRLDDLPESGDALARYTRDAATTRARRNTHQARAAKRLADARDDVVSEVAATLTAVGGEAFQDEFERAAGEFVDDVVDSLEASATGTESSATGTESSATGTDATGERTTRDAANATSAESGSNATDGHASAAAATESTAVSADGASGSAATASEGAHDAAADTARDVEVVDTVASAPPGEYVTRFFDGSTSVSAVGHSHADQAAAQAVDYLVEQHSLDAGLRIPWGPSDDGRKCLINHTPTHPDGTRMSTAQELANGDYLFTSVDAATMRDAIETLAGRSGLRVMFQGDWA